MSNHERDVTTLETARQVRFSPTGRRRVDSEPVTLRISDALLAEIDDWRRTQPDLPIRTEAIRRLVERALKASRHTPRKPAP